MQTCTDAARMYIMHVQVALLVILAQIGCYVPASFMALSPYTSLHTRIGTADSIESNASSFMVEMADVAQLMERCALGVWGGGSRQHGKRYQQLSRRSRLQI
jgi:hypothetical protein